MVSVVPSKFLYALPLQLGTELICALGILNRASGFYGFLSLFTGHPLTTLEWMLNLVSLIVLPIYVIGFRAIQARNPLLVVLFAYIYILDSLSCILFTTSFSVVWFSSTSVAITSNHRNATNRHHSNTSLTNSTSSDNSTSSAEKYLDKSASLPSEAAVSMIVPIFLLMSRLYFSLVVLGYARQLVRQYNVKPHNGTPKGSWTAKLQFLLLSMFQGFWYGGRWAPVRPDPTKTENYNGEEYQMLTSDEYR